MLSTTRQLMFSLPEGCVFLPFLSRRGWNAFAAACTSRPCSDALQALFQLSSDAFRTGPAMVVLTNNQRRNLATTLWTYTCPNRGTKNGVLASVYQPGEQIGRFEKAVFGLTNPIGIGPIGLGEVCNDNHKTHERKLLTMKHFTISAFAGIFLILGGFLLLPTPTFAASLEARAESPRIICTGATPPPGWIIIGHSTDDNQCGGNPIKNFFSGPPYGNMETVAPPPTTSTTICTDSYMPVGFVIKATNPDISCESSLVSALINGADRVTIAPQGQPIKPYNQLIGQDPAAQGCTANTTIISQSPIVDIHQNTVGNVLLLQANNCNMYYSQVTSTNPEIMSASIVHGTTISSSQTLTDFVVLSPMIRDTLPGQTCANGSIRQGNIDYSGATCVSLQDGPIIGR
jgi:hypothetical protein